MQRQKLYSNEPSVSEGGKPCQPMSRLRWVKLMHKFDLHCQPVNVGLMLLSSYLQIKFRQALDLEQRSPLPFERHCDAYFGLVGHKVNSAFMLGRLNKQCMPDDAWC